MNYLEVKKTTGLVQNVIVWDGISTYSRNGFDLIKSDDAPCVWIGWKKIDGVWTAPVIEQPEE